MPSHSLAGFEQPVVVGMADLAVSSNPSVILATYSLGSCLAVAIHDPVAGVGGLLHLMLPDSGINPAKAEVQPGMFADTGIASLLRAASQLGAEKERMQIAVAGGSQVMDSGGYFNIGKRNYEALLQVFEQNHLRIAAEQTGGLVNRTMYLHVGTGDVRLKVSNQPSEMLLLCGTSTTTSTR